MSIKPPNLKGSCQHNFECTPYKLKAEWGTMGMIIDIFYSCLIMTNKGKKIQLLIF